MVLSVLGLGTGYYGDLRPYTRVRSSKALGVPSGSWVGFRGYGVGFRVLGLWSPLLGISKDCLLTFYAGVDFGLGRPVLQRT